MTSVTITYHLNGEVIMQSYPNMSDLKKALYLKGISGVEKYVQQAPRRGGRVTAARLRTFFNKLLKEIEDGE